MPGDVIAELRKMGRAVYTRDQWGSTRGGVYAWRRENRKFVGPADHFFAHITVTIDNGPTSGDFKADCREVEQIGQDRFGTGVSYNWMIDKDSGAIAEGQPLDAAGAHTLNDKNVAGFPANLNYWGHAIAWIGRPQDDISDAAIESYAAIIAAEKATGWAKSDARLYPHSKFAYKDCPCDQVRDRIPSIERRAAEMRERAAAPTRAERAAAARREKGKRLADDLTPTIRKARRGSHRFPRIADRLATIRRQLRGRRETKEGA